MLAAPAYGQFEGVTIFRDDTLFHKFYPIAQAPSIRLDKQGNPIFLLVKYAFSDEDRQRDPALPPGGGYLNFDIQFDVPTDLLERVRAQLQPIVNAEWQHLVRGTSEQQAQPGVANTRQPPPVEFGSPTWTGGSVKMDAPQAAQLVSARVAEASPSLLAGNIAVFNMDLTPAGATFMQEVLLTPSGAGATSLTPIQVSYDLTFWARLPPARIHIKVDSEKVHTYLHQQIEGRGIHSCSPYDFDQTDINFDAASTTGAIDVQIDNAAALPDEVINELRTYSLDLVKQMVEANFFSDQPQEEQQDDEPADHAGDVPETKPDGPPQRYKNMYLRWKSANTKIHIEFNLEQRSVVEWRIHPQSTLQTFFQGMRPEQISQFVRQIDLDDDFFKNLDLTVRAFTNFSDPAISNVEVQVHYEGADESGARVEKNNAFTFTDAEPQTWSVSLIGRTRAYQYRYRVGFTGQDAGAFTKWVSSNSPDLNVSVPNPGRISVDVVAGDVDFANLVDSLQVHLAYEDLDAGIAHEESTVLLSATKLADQYQRLILKPLQKPVQYRTRIKLKSGDVQESDEWRDHRGPQLLINQSFNDTLRVNLLPSGNGWDDIVQAMVDLRYEDAANNYVVDETIQLRSKDEFKTWRVFLKNKNAQEFKYRWTVSYKNGHLSQSEWQAGTGDTTLPIVVNHTGIKVVVLADALDFAACPLTEVTCHYNIAAVDRQETFVFRDKTPQTWNIDAPEGAPVEFTYRVTHSPMGHDPVTLPEVREKDTVVVLPQFQAPRAGKLSVQAICPVFDTAAVSLVAVDLKYDDDQNSIHEIGALTFMQQGTQTWEVPVKDSTLRQFGYRLTYFKTDSTEQSSDWKFQDIPRIVVPKQLVP